MSNDKTSEKLVRRKTKVSSIYANQIRVSRDLRSSREANLMENQLIFWYLRTIKGDGIEDHTRADGIAR